MAGAGGRCCEPWCAARVRHGGATLVYVLCLLVIILLLGISAAQMALQGEKAARGERDRQIAFQAAEEALVDAQNDIEGLPGAPGRSSLFAPGSAAGFADGCGEGGALGLVKALHRREGVGVVAADLEAAHVDAETTQGVGQHELAAEDADGAGQGRGLGHDPVGFRTDPIAARGRIGPHGDDHRLARRLGRAHGGQDLFRGLGRTARRGDAEDDGLHGLVLYGVIDGLGRIVGTDVRARAEGRGPNYLPNLMNWTIT